MGKRKKLYKPQHPNCFKDGTIYQYVYVASKILDRPLKIGEQVHHIDCDPTNNSPQNLMVFNSNSDHIKFHKYNLDKNSVKQIEDGSYIIKDDYVYKSIKNDYVYKSIKYNYICSYCGKQYLGNYSRHCHQYCSQDCYQKSQRRFELTIKQLENLVKQYSLSQIGRMYGVSCNAIKKRCLKYNIDYKQYEQQIKSKNMKKVMQEKYKDYINTKQICPICGKWKRYNSKTCRDCYINKKTQLDIVQI